MTIEAWRGKALPFVYPNGSILTCPGVSGDVKESVRGWLGISHVHRALWMGRELFRLARPDRKGAACLVHKLHSRRGLRIQVQVLSEGTWRNASKR